jgi:hypothetical protein
VEKMFKLFSRVAMKFLWLMARWFLGVVCIKSCRWCSILFFYRLKQNLYTSYIWIISQTSFKTIIFQQEFLKLCPMKMSNLPLLITGSPTAIHI